MSKDIDWSKAPEGADRYNTFNKRFYRGERPNMEVFDKGGWRKSCLMEKNEYFITRDQQGGWTGQGLPPVGTVCECHGTVSQELRRQEFSWRKVEIIAHTNFGGDDIAVGRDDECATLGWGIASRFRPIRTPEQIAAEEREKSIQEIEELIAGYSYGKCAELIYDAGYRKTEVGK